VVAGNRDEAVYRLHAARLVGFATVLVGPADAQDVVSAAVLRCLSSPGWSDVANVEGYLYRAVLNTARSYRRAELRMVAREARTASPAGTTETEAQPEVWAAVARLSVRQRAVTVLTYIEDLTPAQVAARLGMSEGSVRRHLARARARLRRMLDD
jgi:RNA polymerase sigma factor (sigma-70 family)